MMKNLTTEQKNKILGFIILVLIVGGLFYSKFRNTEVKDVSPEEQKIEDPLNVLKDQPEEVKESNTKTNSQDPVAQYKNLITLGHAEYLKNNYNGALSYFNQALKLQQNDRIYRSIYSTYLAMGNYTEAQKAIKKSVSFNSGIPNNWIEYANFEHLYMKAGFETVNKIYKDALIATKENIDILTSYATFLVEYKKYNEAIVYLEKAKIAYPNNTAIYQAEIDRLKTQ